MRTAGTVAAALGIMAVLAAPARAATYDSAADIATALKNRPVAVDSRAKPPVTAAEQAALIADIRRRDPGRIHIAYVPKELATQAGSVKALANSVSDRLGKQGVVLVAAGEDVYLITSYFDTDAALEAVHGAFARTEKTETPGRQLLEVARALAAVDPGEGSSDDNGEGVTTVNPRGLVRALEIFFLSLVGLVVVIALVIVVPRVVRARRSHEAFDEAMSDRRSAARAALVNLGEAIGDLDIDTQMPSADAQGMQHYAAAVDAYDRGEQQLDAADSERRLAAAEQTIAAGRGEMDRARARLRPNDPRVAQGAPM